MEFIDPRLLEYCEQHSEPESPLLAELNRQTHLKTSSPRMLSGHIQGRILSMVSKLISPASILEIGTYTGYSALCLAEGLAPGGKLITIDRNDETNAMARRYFERSPFKERIILMEGRAEEIIPSLGTFDLVFIDADKQNYPLYFELIIDKVRHGGLIIADNVLWSGKVLETAADKDTRVLQQFNQLVRNDKRVQSLILPVRDGLTLLRKI